MALGLAIGVGLMGVINMAHGELMALAPTARSSCRTSSAPLADRFERLLLVARPVSSPSPRSWASCSSAA